MPAPRDHSRRRRVRGVAAAIAASAFAATAATAVAVDPIDYPLSFSAAAEAGIEVEWGERCDTETGRLAIPDPYAAECFAPLTGDNGGETARGVTGDTITIVMYMEQEADPIISFITDAIASDDTNGERFETMENLVRYYETYHETYGRHVELIRFEASGNALDEVAARADAVRIAEDIQPFMVWGGPVLTPAFADELAAREILCFGCATGQPDQFYADRHPYVWSIDMSPAQRQDHLVEFIEKQLIGHPASHAGEEFVETERTFGLVYIDTGSGQAELAEVFAERMEAAGAPLAESIAFMLDPATIQQTALQAITKLKSAGVTTVIMATDPLTPREFSREATAQGYFPEWLGSATLVDTTAFARTYDQEQWQHAMALTVIPARLSPEVAGISFVYEWFTGSSPPADTRVTLDYLPAAVFFPVLQGTGPELTSESWVDTLTGAEPQATGAISRVSLTWGEHERWAEFDHNGVDDATLVWWDPEATGLDEVGREGTGMYQYANGGARYLPDEWPDEDTLFDPSNSVTIYDVPPAGEEPPSYPSPAG